jgi:hypothetical protein
MKHSAACSLLALASLIGMPVLADQEQHRHGQDDAAPAAAVTLKQPAQAAAMDDMKSGGKSGKKCNMGKGGGGGHDHGAAAGGGHDHGAGPKADGGRDDALEARLRQMEKRLDAMQTTLDLLAGQRDGKRP